MAETAAIFLAYTSFQNMIRKYTPGKDSPDEVLPLPQLGAAAAAAGFATSFVVYVVLLLLTFTKPNFSSAG